MKKMATVRGGVFLPLTCSSFLLLLVLLLFHGVSAMVHSVQGDVSDGTLILLVEPVNEDVVHFELRSVKKGEEFIVPPTIETSILVKEKQPSTASFNFKEPVDNGVVWTLEGERVIVQVTRPGLAVTMYRRKDPSAAKNVLTVFSYFGMQQYEHCGYFAREEKQLKIHKMGYKQHVYGLGQYKLDYGSTDGDFMGKSAKRVLKWDQHAIGNNMYYDKRYYDKVTVENGQDLDYYLVKDRLTNEISRRRKEHPNEKSQWKRDHGQSQDYLEEWHVHSVTQVPVMFVLGEGPKHIPLDELKPWYQNYAVFIDSPRPLEWNFEQLTQMTATIRTDTIRWYMITGEDMPAVRKGYMNIVGHTPMPPKKMLGLWQSIFGYRSWEDMWNDVNLLIEKKFPLDGAILDYYWFGNVAHSWEDSSMGRLEWAPDWSKNGQVKTNGEKLKSKGLGISLIEESYVTLSTNSYKKMEQSEKHLVFENKGRESKTLLLHEWFGKSGMIDWTNPAAGQAWHQCKRCPLIEGCNYPVDTCAGFSEGNTLEENQLDITAHWCDLGEPECFSMETTYKGYPENGLQKTSHWDVHNVYNMYWAKSIYDGYLKTHLTKRPWILARSGTAGINRYGVSMWSGDIWPSLGDLAVSLNSQMHMGLAGIDYFGSDVGGFHKPFGLLTPVDESQIYTQWFANSAWFDIPLRPHTRKEHGECKQVFESSPAKVGHLPSNLFNTRQRYALIPYYYTLAYRAWKYGEPVVPPALFYYQNDPKLHSLGSAKMIGRDILVTAATGFYKAYDSSTHSLLSHQVYLPEGTWVNYHTHAYQQGQNSYSVPLVIDQQTGAACTSFDSMKNDAADCVFTLPVFVRAGAILPVMLVDEDTGNALGFRRNDKPAETALRAKVFVPAADTKSEFKLYEDDGVSTEYRLNEIKKELELAGNKGDILSEMAKVFEDYSKATTTRRTLLKLDGNSERATFTVTKAKGTYRDAPAVRDIVIDFIFPTVAGGIQVQANNIDITCGDVLDHTKDSCAWNSNKRTLTVQLPRVSHDKESLISFKPVQDEDTFLQLQTPNH